MRYTIWENSAFNVNKKLCATSFFSILWSSMLTFRLLALMTGARARFAINILDDAAADADWASSSRNARTLPNDHATSNPDAEDATDGWQYLDIREGGATVIYKIGFYFWIIRCCIEVNYCTMTSTGKLPFYMKWQNKY